MTDTAQPNTDAGDQTTLIAVSAAVGAGLVVILAAGLAGLAALTYYWLVKRKRHKHGLFSTITQVNEKSCRLKMATYRDGVKSKGDKIGMGV